MHKNPNLWPGRIFFEMILPRFLAILRTPNPGKDLSAHLNVLVTQLVFISW